MDTKSLACALDSSRHHETCRSKWRQVFVLSLTQKARHLCQLGSPSYANFRKLKQWMLKFSSTLHVFHKSQRGQNSVLHHPQGFRLTESHLCGVSKVTATVGEEEEELCTDSSAPTECNNSCQFCWPDWLKQVTWCDYLQEVGKCNLIVPTRTKTRNNNEQDQCLSYHEHMQQLNNNIRQYVIKD